MSYPDLPSNRVIVDGVDLSERFKMVLLDGYTLDPPEPKLYVVDIPGGNSKLDLTESLMGDVAYDTRSQEFEFIVPYDENFEKTKTLVSNFLHGKSYDYKLTMDPGYTYHGRFKVSYYSHEMYDIGVVGTIKVIVDADPFKYKESQVYKINGVGGYQAYIPSGRKRVKPVVETDGYLKIIFNKKEFTLQKGSWSINDIMFKDGVNDIYFNSYKIRNLTWNDLKINGVTWGDFKKKPLYEWYKSNGDGTLVMNTWSDLANRTWQSVSEETWGSLSYESEKASTVKDVYIKSEWGDI